MLSLKKSSKGVLFAFACAAMIILYLFFLLPKSYFETKIEHFEKPTTDEVTTKYGPLYCYQSHEVDSLPDISKTKPPKNSIFFIETTCNSLDNGKITIQRRQACSVESAAYTNPNSSVYLLYVSPSNLKLEGSDSDRLLEALLSYKNVNLRHINFEEYARGSPAEKVFDAVRSSKYAQSHASDMLRFLTLWKYGGFYLDLDVVVFKPLEILEPTFAGAESESYVGSAILRFDSSGAGHEFARKCLEDFGRDYRPNEWGYNGPGVLTRMFMKSCNVTLLKEAINKTCDGVTLHPPAFFFPVNYGNWKHYFEEQFTEEVMRETRDSFVVHIWNKLSENSSIPSIANVPYIKFAQKYCPKVYQLSPEHF